MTTLSINTPRWALPLLQPSRYKAIYGGRGSGKSHFFAELLIARCLRGRTRAVCIREVQNTLKESVHQLLSMKIREHGLEGMFEILESEIRAPYGGLIIFKGMQSYNAGNIKSLEDYDIAWVEEAHLFSKRSLTTLRPTIRAEGSELWFSWNPENEDDPVDAFFRGETPPNEAIIIPVNWKDNPWFPSVLKREMAEDYAKDEELARHVWGGDYLMVSEASYYGRWVHKAEEEGRIKPLRLLPWKPIITSWDIGVDDYTAIWFWQEDGVNAYVHDFYETQGDGAEQIIRDALQPKNAMNGPHYFPHDVAVREWGAGARSRRATLAELGVYDIRTGKATNPEHRIEATRKLLPITYFNDTKSVRIGLSHLRRYSRKRNEQMGVWQGPLHDEHSHAADAFGEFAVNGPIYLDKVAAKKEPEFEVESAPEPGVIATVSMKDLMPKPAAKWDD